jgi:predicted glutamine amidotransferase
MCRVLIMSGINPENQENAWSFIMGMSTKMSVGNNDGMGYAALSQEGELFGERWLYNNSAFIKRDLVTDFDREVIENYEGAFKKKEVYNKFGTLTQNISAICLHARYATTSKDFMNTHPFVVENTALIHNGVIRNAKRLDMFQSTCDSETILNEYLKFDVSGHPEMINAVASKLEGYYACGVLTKNSDNISVLDVFKDSGATLFAVAIQELGGPIFATCIENVEEVCEDLGFTIVSCYEVVGGNLMRFNAMTGKLMVIEKFSATYGGKKGLTAIKKSHHGGMFPTAVDTEEWAQNADGYWSRTNG